MIEILPKDFTEVWPKLNAALAFCAPPRSVPAPRRGETVTAEQQKTLIELLTELWNTCKKWHLKESLFAVDEARSWLVDPARHATGDPVRPDAYQIPKHIPLTDFPSIYKELVSIRTKLHEELDSIRFALIEPSKAQFFVRDDLFGKAFHDAAPADITAEIKAAGNCLALDLKTAAVFHLMRTAELGLRKLANRLGARLKHPLEFADWGRVIDACDAKLKNLKPTTRGKKKSAHLEFYANAISECRAFKETWRDCVMHARRADFSTKEAVAVFERVRDFMNRLAERGLLK
jgi:hypothetical protein